MKLISAIAPLSVATSLFVTANGNELHLRRALHGKDSSMSISLIALDEGAGKREAPPLKDDGNYVTPDVLPVITETATGLGISIPDDDAAGTTYSFGVSDECLIGKVTIALGINHNFVGDLLLKLISPGGTEVGLVSRADGDDPGGDNGDNSNARENNPITFDDASVNDPQTWGAGVDGTTAIPAGTFFSEGPVQLQALSGESSKGDWTVFVSDVRCGIAGILQSVSLTITCASPLVVEGACCARGGCFDSTAVNTITCAEVLEGNFLGDGTTCGPHEHLFCKKNFVVDLLPGHGGD